MGLSASDAPAGHTGGGDHIAHHHTTPHPARGALGGLCGSRQPQTEPVLNLFAASHTHHHHIRFRRLGRCWKGGDGRIAVPFAPGVSRAFCCALDLPAASLPAGPPPGLGQKNLWSRTPTSAEPAWCGPGVCCGVSVRGAHAMVLCLRLFACLFAGTSRPADRWRGRLGLPWDKGVASATRHTGCLLPEGTTQNQTPLLRALALPPFLRSAA